jgi:DNA-binding PadR family transcriptional regulator
MTVNLSTTEYAVLGVLGEGATHGFALSKLLAADGEVGRVFRVRRPLVYRALDRLVEAGYAESVSTEKGDAGPQRVVHKITRRGRRRLDRWLTQPVDHVRDIRIEFLLKLALLHRRGRSPVDLIRDQKAALLPTFSALEVPPSDDYLELWRRHNAAAALTYLDDLESRHRDGNR